MPENSVSAITPKQGEVGLSSASIRPNMETPGFPNTGTVPDARFPSEPIGASSENPMRIGGKPQNIIPAEQPRFGSDNQLPFDLSRISQPEPAMGISSVESPSVPVVTSEPRRDYQYSPARPDPSSYSSLTSPRVSEQPRSETDVSSPAKDSEIKSPKVLRDNDSGWDNLKRVAADGKDVLGATQDKVAKAIKSLGGEKKKPLSKAKDSEINKDFPERKTDKLKSTDFGKALSLATVVTIAALLGQGGPQTGRGSDWSISSVIPKELITRDQMLNAVDGMKKWFRGLVPSELAETLDRIGSQIGKQLDPQGLLTREPEGQFRDALQIPKPLFGPQQPDTDIGSISMDRKGESFKGWSEKMLATLSSKELMMATLDNAKKQGIKVMSSAEFSKYFDSDENRAREIFAWQYDHDIEPKQAQLPANDQRLTLAAAGLDPKEVQQFMEYMKPNMKRLNLDPFDSKGGLKNEKTGYLAGDPLAAFKRMKADKDIKERATVTRPGAPI